MGTQTMGSQQQKTHALAREGSLYSLTLDEVQHQLGDLGKPLSSMNLDELLKSVWIAEANQGVASFDYSAAQNGQVSSMSSSNKQPSLSLTKDLSHKTVDEVWQNIQQNQKKKKSSLGEMTLEDFLVKAGVVAESSGLAKNNTEPVLGVDTATMNQQNVPNQAHWMNFQLPAVHQPPPPPPRQHQQQQNMMSVFMPGHSVQQPLPMGANTIMDAAYPDVQMNMSPSALMGTLSDTQTPGRKRLASGEVVEKTVERRQKRMIKNRESAARSRARKQAYTHELENKISRLEEENERLKQQQEVEKVLPSAPPPEPKFQLRRTSSAPL